MKAGKLRHFVSFQVPTVEIDSNGDQTETWVDSFDAQEFPAAIEPLSGRELIAAAQVHAEVTTRILLQYIPGILPEMRVVHRGVNYNIRSIIPDDKYLTRHVTLLCTSGTNDG